MVCCAWRGGTITRDDRRRDLVVEEARTEIDVKKIVLMTAGLLSAVPLAGCNSPYPQDRAASGAVLGGATGAVIGGLATGRPAGALVGGAVGAATGAIVGANSPPPPPPGPRPCARFGQDYYGNTVCVLYY